MSRAYWIKVRRTPLSQKRYVVYREEANGTHHRLGTFWTRRGANRFKRQEEQRRQGGLS